MATLRRLERIQGQLVHFSWTTVWLLLIGHGGVSWLLMHLAGETRITDPGVFLYFWITTGTTVGYGDYAPFGIAGRLVTVLWIMPGAILWISTVLAKIASASYTTWRSTMQRDVAGLAEHKDLENHTIVLGYVASRTPRIIQLLREQDDDDADNTILLVATNLNNPLPDSDVLYTRAASLTDEEALSRAKIDKASVIICLGPNDSETLAASLAAAAANESVHLVSYFEQPSSAKVLRLHCPQAEIINAVYVESIARAAQDPGSSKLIGELLDPAHGQTQFSLNLPLNTNITVGDLFVRLKSEYEAMLLGVRGRDQQMLLNPPWALKLHAGDTVYYMAQGRIKLSAEDCVL